MALVLRIQLPVDELLAFDALLHALEGTMDRVVSLDEASTSFLDRGERECSWCPWPRARLGLFIVGQSTRGTELGVELRGAWLLVEVSHPALGSWTDFRLAVEAAAAIADAGGRDVELVDGQILAPAAARAHLLDEPARWESLVERAAESLRAAVEGEGRTVRLAGPAGTSWIGPRTWARIVQEGPKEELVSRLLDRLQASIDGRGWDGFYSANPMILDGRSGREVVACLLPPGQATILRDPEFVLLSEDLEADGGGPMWLLPFNRIEEALPGLVTWIDERTAAVGAVPLQSWAARLAHARPHLISMPELLDGPGLAPAPAVPSDSGPPTGAARPPSRPWWRRWS
jgi:hypothetical protein